MGTIALDLLELFMAAGNNLQFGLIGQGAKV